jgi:RES domain-containing protein
MELWRISNYPDLSGIGGLRAAGRWHSQGRRIVYLADHSSSALLEMLVHMDRDLMPATSQLLRIVVPADIAVETVPSACRTLANQAAFHLELPVT